MTGPPPKGEPEEIYDYRVQRLVKDGREKEEGEGELKRASERGGKSESERALESLKLQYVQSSSLSSMIFPDSV